ncbi:hypothetical protein PLESTB_001050300 [Pleodorina starrii]|uniref:Uncharacterized protein n=1 Tax=Pleodorina starrii TaxID=330485 RepID=A0A9W6BQE7_9CHLO|nr:hypothetical protein PLESTM_001268500 [Pleodorina starrii]GLC55970.1 hypothetical protein PLESTB_001050300 [Pleodorina starrii]GLC63957.1 hypothetical protein PLESTF_000102800 [Pleodorina starrii]
MFFISRSTAPTGALSAARRAWVGSRRWVIAIAAVAIALAACIAAQSNGGGGGGGGSPAVPPECMDASVDMQSKCSDEVNAGLTALGIDPNAVQSDPNAVQIDIKRLQAFLDKADPPSAQCCDATAKFNNQYCSCSSAVLDLVLSFTNDDLNQYRTLSKYFERGCKQIGKPYTLYLEDTCPADKRK